MFEGGIHRRRQHLAAKAWAYYHFRHQKPAIFMCSLCLAGEIYSRVILSIFQLVEKAQHINCYLKASDMIITFVYRFRLLHLFEDISACPAAAGFYRSVLFCYDY